MACLALAAWTLPASAGVLAEVAATNFRTRLLAVVPEVPGLTLEVIDLGNRLRLTNRTGTEVTVLGYDDEPYLRVSGEGVFTNRRSPATYLNADRQATRTPPDDAATDAPPEWVRVSSARIATWYDHRVHWMGLNEPPAVRADPGRRHVVFPSWTVPLLHGDERVEARGDLVWVPGPGLWPWLLVAVAPLGAATLLLGAASFYRYDGWAEQPLAVAAVLVLGAAAGLVLGVAHRGPALIGGGAVACAAAGLAVVLLARRRAAGLYAAAGAGVLVAALAALALADLTESQVPWAWSPPAARALAATSLGLGVVVATAAGLALRRRALVDQ